MLRQNNVRLVGSVSPLRALWSTERATAGKATTTTFIWYDASSRPRKTQGPNNENSRRGSRPSESRRREGGSQRCCVPPLSIASGEAAGHHCPSRDRPLGGQGTELGR